MPCVYYPGLCWLKMMIALRKAAGCGEQGPGREAFDCHPVGWSAWPVEFLWELPDPYTRVDHVRTTACEVRRPWATGRSLMSIGCGGARCRAWSAPKKVWCCKEKGKGCQSPDTPPACDAGAGKVWKRLGL